MTSNFHHLSVLLDECLDGLAIKPGGIYVDGTLGGGGHSSEIVKRLETGRLIGIDRDDDALKAAQGRIKSDRFTALKGNFHDAKSLLQSIGVNSVDGVLLDLGVSSYQLDEASRGFSYHADAPLDMRMDRTQPLTAQTIVNEWPQGDIAALIKDYGEEPWAVQIARVICDRRNDRPIETTAQLVEIIDRAIPKKVRSKDGSHPARRTFQALRIAVNDELAPLKTALEDFVSILAPGGRICVIAFHSLEDRIVKNTFRELQNPCTCPKNMPICVCGKVPQLRIITRKPITASEAELERNPRARSATLRIGEKRLGDAVP